jgi:hypothetical protein
MNFIRRILKPATTASTTNLGRWQLHYDPKIVDSKVDQANEDHCGCCHESQHINQALKKEQTLRQKQKWHQKQQQRQ